MPAHVTLRLLPGLPSLRSERCLAALRPALTMGRERQGFRVVHFSMQHDHVHVIAEAESTRALSRGMAGLSIRFARRLNAALGRKGRVFAARFHAVPVKNPQQARRVLAYVLCNSRHHAAQRGVLGSYVAIDPCSSGASFDGWRPNAALEPVPPWRAPVDELVMPAASWLLREGWRRHGLIDPAEIPGTHRSRRV